MPKVSVVMAVYNGERFLAETLDNILNQSFQDFELIAIDDGSTDNTHSILSRYQASDPRIIVERNPTNLGIPKSRNRGCQLAKGDYIAVTDADDVSLKGRFEQQVRFLEQHQDIALVGSAVESINETGEVITRFDMPTSPGLIKWMLIFANVFAHSTVMMRRAAVESIGFYSEQIPVALDYDLVTRMSMSYQLANLPDVWVHYRISEQSVTTRQKPLQEQYTLHIMQQLASHYLGQPVTADDAAALRVIGGQQLPENRAQLQCAASLLQRLYRAFVSTVELSSEESNLVALDAAVKYYGLAWRAWRHSPSDALRFVAAGVLLSPRSIGQAAATLTRTLTRKRK